MEASCVSDITVTCPGFIDLEVFDLWIEGGSVSHVASMLLKSLTMEEFSLTNEMIATHVRDHFAQFGNLELFLRQPELFLQDSMNHQLPYEVRLASIHKYYSLDEHFLRELVGLKLSNKSRRDLAELSERCNLQLKSCKRQFDNLLNVSRRIEDLPGQLIDNIKHCFLLPDSLAERYAAVIFITNNRFEVSKRSLSYVTFADLAYCAGQLMKYWSMNVKDINGETYISNDIDLQFLNDLKEIKILIEKKDYLYKHKTLVIRGLTELNSKSKLMNFGPNFKTITKSIIYLACGLSHAKEMRDFFLDIVDDVIEPMRNLNWSLEDVELFFNVYSSTAKSLISSKSASFSSIWTRFIIPFSNCVLRFYHD